VRKKATVPDARGVQQDVVVADTFVPNLRARRENGAVPESVHLRRWNVPELDIE
jgi:hypothetical protein